MARYKNDAAEYPKGRELVLQPRDWKSLISSGFRTLCRIRESNSCLLLGNWKSGPISNGFRLRKPVLPLIGAGYENRTRASTLGRSRPTTKPIPHLLQPQPAHELLPPTLRRGSRGRRRGHHYDNLFPRLCNAKCRPNGRILPSGRPQTV